MINLDSFSDCKIGIFGLGKTGIDSLNAFLVKETQIIAWDDNKENILNIVNNETHLSKEKKSEVVAYLKSFFEEIETKGI